MTVAGVHILGGRYVLKEVLGTGGMATVWRATDEVLGRDVAVKVLNQQYAADAAFLARFRREARNVAALRDARIVTVFDTSADDDLPPYIVMELLAGRTLRQVLDEEGPMPPAEAMGVAAAVCEGLEAAHAAGLVHRDIKPANILLSGRDVKVLDFGIARAPFPAGGTRTQAVLGTAAYLSPEQAAGLAAGPQADLYGLGCVLFEMLTGTPPFSAESEVAVAYRQVHDKPPLPSTLRAGLSPKHDLVTMQLLAKEPEGRPAGAAAARAALLSTLTPDQTTILDAQPAPAQAPSHRAPREARFAWRPTETVLAMGLIAALAALAIVLVTPAAVRSPGSPRRAHPTQQATPAAQPTPSTSPDTSPSASVTPSVPPPSTGPPPQSAQATGALVTSLDAGVASGQVTLQAGQQLMQQVTQLVFSTPSQDPTQVEQQYSQLVVSFEQLQAQGQINGQAATTIRSEISTLGSALGAG